MQNFRKNPRGRVPGRTVRRGKFRFVRLKRPLFWRWFVLKLPLNLILLSVAFFKTVGPVGRLRGVRQTPELIFRLVVVAKKLHRGPLIIF